MACTEQLCKEGTRELSEYALHSNSDSRYDQEIASHGCQYHSKALRNSKHWSGPIQSKVQMQPQSASFRPLLVYICHATRRITTPAQLQQFIPVPLSLLSSGTLPRYSSVHYAYLRSRVTSPYTSDLAFHYHIQCKSLLTYYKFSSHSITIHGCETG